ncbi:MAG TPA: PIN domain-containing protein [Pyrinomonadaceae bacterium]|nr:PIN domain-containing protein [Pyrinomonadaceae bacterium]
MSEEPSVTLSEAAELRVVVDAQIVLAMFLARRDDPEWRSPKRQLLRLLSVPSFHWLWSADIISDYEQGAQAIEADERIMQRAVFDRLGFELFLATLRLAPAVRVSATTMRRARRRIEQAPRAAERDLEDAVYLTCAVDGSAHLITTEDSDLRSLGDKYEGVLILSWNEFRNYLRRRGLIVAQDE